MPTISAPAALEISMGIAVDRLGHAALEQALVGFLPGD